MGGPDDLRGTLGELSYPLENDGRRLLARAEIPVVNLRAAGHSSIASHGFGFFCSGWAADKDFVGIQTSRYRPNIKLG